MLSIDPSDLLCVLKLINGQKYNTIGTEKKMQGIIFVFSSANGLLLSSLGQYIYMGCYYSMA